MLAPNSPSASSTSSPPSSPNPSLNRRFTARLSQVSLLQSLSTLIKSRVSEDGTGEGWAVLQHGPRASPAVQQDVIVPVTTTAGQSRMKRIVRRLSRRSTADSDHQVGVASDDNKCQVEMVEHAVVPTLPRTPHPTLRTSRPRANLDSSWVTLSDPSVTPAAVAAAVAVPAGAPPAYTTYQIQVDGPMEGGGRGRGGKQAWYTKATVTHECVVA